MILTHKLFCTVPDYQSSPVVTNSQNDRSLCFAYVPRNEGFPVSALIPVRIMAGTRKRLYVSPILAPLHRLPVKSRIKLQILLIT